MYTFQGEKLLVIHDNTVFIKSAPPHIRRIKEETDAKGSIPSNTETNTYLSPIPASQHSILIRILTLGTLPLVILAKWTVFFIFISFLNIPCETHSVFPHTRINSITTRASYFRALPRGSYMSLLLGN